MNSIIQKAIKKEEKGFSNVSKQTSAFSFLDERLQNLCQNYYLENIKAIYMDFSHKEGKKASIPR